METINKPYRDQMLKDFFKKRRYLGLIEIIFDFLTFEEKILYSCLNANIFNMLKDSNIEYINVNFYIK